MASLNKYGSLTVSIAAIVIGIALWGFGSLHYDPLLLPSPLAVASAAVELWQAGSLQSAIAVSLQRVLQGWLLGSLVAIPVGLLAGVSKLARAALDPFIQFFRFVPALALTSLFILWLGVGEISKVMLIAYATAFTVVVSTAGGASSIHPDKIRGARTMGAGNLTLFFRVLLPGTFGPIFTGMRLALGNAFLVLVAAEIINAQEGIGFIIWNSRSAFRTDHMFLGILCFGVLGFCSDRIWRWLGRTVFKRYLTSLGDY